jgi:predicted nucleotidyltransferase
MSPGLIAVPSDILQRFLLSHYPGRVVLQVALMGAQGFGYGNRESPIELKGIFVEATENLVGLSDPPRSYNWVGEFEGLRIDYSSYEIGYALRMLLRGDGSILERIFAPLQLLGPDEIESLRRVASGAISQRFFNFYRNCGKGVLHRTDDEKPPTVTHLLSAYRAALTGAYLLGTGKVLLDLRALARHYGLDEVEQLIQQHRELPSESLRTRGQWAKLMVKVHSMLEEAMDISEVPVDPEHPDWAESYLLELRRRYFHAISKAAK